MIRRNLRESIAIASLVSLFLSGSVVFAAPVRIAQVQQVITASPDKAKSGSFTRLQLSENGSTTVGADDDTKTGTPQKDDERVIMETRSEIVEDDACDCAQIPIAKRGFPKWTLLGLAAIPAGILIARSFRDKDVEPTPTPVTIVTPTPPETPTPNSPTPDPVPEPMTILLFGTGLAGIGISMRRRLRKNEN